MPHISNCSMMPAWHQLVSMSGHVEESETARKLQLYETSIYQVHSFVCQLDYQERSCWSQTPSIVAWSTKLREQPLIFNSVGWGTSVLKHIWRAWHFAGFKLRLLFSVHWLNESKITCNWLESGCVRFSAIVRSSTYFQQLMGPELFCTASLIITWKPMGPNLMPCGRPADEVAKSERVELYLTHCIRLLRNPHNQETIDLRFPMWINFPINNLWSTISKAFERSVRTTVPKLLTLSAPCCKKCI